MLVGRGGLSAAERAALAGIDDRGGLCGVLRPQRPWLSVLAVDGPTAELYLEIARTPGAAAARQPAGRCAAIERLILDGVLELDADGSFLSGAAAQAWMHRGSPEAVGAGRIAQLSRDALAYAQTVISIDRAALSRRLYLYHHLPLSAAWRRRLPSSAAVADLLGVGPGGRNRRLLDGAGRCTIDDWWLRWRARDDPADAGHHYKLYLSPSPAHLSDAFSCAVRVFVESGTPRFKVARSTGGVLRPDKLVAYFADEDHVRAVGERLGRELEGTPAHGVPFTAALDDQGLLSYGVDPPRSEACSAGRAISWRSWVTDRLASALVIARHTPAADREASEFALHRLALAGVDITTWTPKDVDWARPAFR